MTWFRVIAVAALLAAIVPAHASEASTSRVVSDARRAMGTTLEIRVVARDEEMAREALDAAFGLVGRLEKILASGDGASDASHLNRRAGAGPQRVAPELGDLLARSVALSAETEGAFDVTVGPLIVLWRSASERGEAPSSQALAQARARVGSSQIRVDPNGVVDLPRAGMSVDLGPVARGYALDRLVPLLRRHGVRAALLGFGGSSVRAFGRPPDDTVWRVALTDGEGGTAGVVALENESVSVARSLVHWSEIGERRRAPAIDPRSGEPLVRDVEATVIARSATRADALSTALLALGPEEGIRLIANAPHTEARIVLAGGEVYRTPGFERVDRPGPSRP